MEKLDNIVFYAIDKAIRSYRQFAQKRLKDAGFTITIDQWLVIKAILENPSIPQNEIGDLVFKDNASVTRIMSHLEKAGYLLRTVNESDRRKINLKVTRKGEKIIQAVQELVTKNRKDALAGISEEEIAITHGVMARIAENTAKPSEKEQTA